MNERRKEELITRWVDGGLTESERRELEPLLQEHPELEQERADYRRLREDLRAAVPDHLEPPYPDFFNSHLEKMIRDEERRSEQLGPDRLDRWSWLRFGLAPAAAALAVMAFFAGQRLGNPEQVVEVDARRGAIGPAVYSPMVEVEVEAWEDSEAGVTVIVLDGLAEIPNSVDLLQTTASLEDLPLEDVH